MSDLIIILIKLLSLYIIKYIRIPFLLNRLYIKNQKVNLNNIEKILITRLQCMGDMIVIFPTIHALRCQFPQAKICLLSWEVSGMETAKLSPHIDEIIPFGLYSNFFTKLNFLILLREKKFDIFIASSQEVGLAKLGFLIGAKWRVGFDKRIKYGKVYLEKSPFLYTTCVKYQSNKHEVSQNLLLTDAIGIKKECGMNKLKVLNQDKRYVENLLSNSIRNYKNRKIPLIGIHPGSKRLSKRWFPKRFAKVADILIEKYSAKIIILGSSDEIVLAKEISSFMKHSPLIFSGKTSVTQLAALLEELSFILCNDSGPAHLAATLHIPVIVIFGSGEYPKWYPYPKSEINIAKWKALPCSPCDHSCNDLKCLDLITVDEILYEITILIKYLSNNKFQKNNYNCLRSEKINIYLN